MSEPFKPQPSELEENNDRRPPKREPHLTLVVSNSAPSKPEHSDVGFYAEIQCKSSQVYEMVAQDPSHSLTCPLKLEVIENPDGYGTGVICHFPLIEDEAFNGFVEEDETLYGTLMIRFQMDIMEQLLLFCADHDASGLIIYVDDAQARELGIYDNILVRQEQIILRDLGEKTVLVIQAHRKAFDKWVDLMQDVSQQLEQDLWLEQRFNPAIRAYLKSRRVIH